MKETSKFINLSHKVIRGRSKNQREIAFTTGLNEYKIK